MRPRNDAPASPESRVVTGTVEVNGQPVDAARLLAALYNHARSGHNVAAVFFLPGDRMSAEDAQRILDGMTRFEFDYVRGRSIKVHAGWTDQTRGVIDQYAEALYDRDNGPGAFAAAVREATS